MGEHSDRQREILQKIGIDVWKLRAVDVADGEDSTEPDSQDSARLSGVDPESGDDLHSTPAGPVADSMVDPIVDDTGQSLHSIEQAVSQCSKCELHHTRINTVFGCGNTHADWLFVGEAPGQNEDIQGQPFVGRAGKLLDMMIAALGMKREQVFIANVLKCRPPNNRDPLIQEIDQCEPYLHQQLALIKPKVIVALGRISAQALLKTTQPLGKLRGRVYRYGPNDIPLVITYHPAYLLRSPEQKARAWEDLWQARMIVQQ